MLTAINVSILVLFSLLTTNIVSILLCTGYTVPVILLMLILYMSMINDTGAGTEKKTVKTN